MSEESKKPVAKPASSKPAKPKTKVVRLVQMDGYVQYHLDNGTSGSTSDKEKIADLQKCLSETRAKKQS